jgi:hypothetical protein
MTKYITSKNSNKNFLKFSIVNLSSYFQIIIEILKNNLLNLILTSFLLKNDEAMKAAIVLPINAVYVFTMARLRASSPKALAALNDGQNTQRKPAAVKKNY